LGLFFPSPSLFFLFGGAPVAKSGETVAPLEKLYNQTKMFKAVFNAFLGQPTKDDSQDIDEGDDTPSTPSSQQQQQHPAVTVTTPEGEEVDIEDTMESGTNSARKIRPMLSEMHKRLGASPEGGKLTIATVPVRLFVSETNDPIQFFVPEEMQFGEVLKNLIEVWFHSPCSPAPPFNPPLARGSLFFPLSLFSFIFTVKLPLFQEEISFRLPSTLSSHLQFYLFFSFA